MRRAGEADLAMLRELQSVQEFSKSASSGHLQRSSEDRQRAMFALVTAVIASDCITAA